PHWFFDNKKFWYRNDLRDGMKEFVVVDAERGTRELAFDHSKLAAALTQGSGKQCTADKLPFSEIQFTDSDKAVGFESDGKMWKCDLERYQCSTAEAAPTSANATTDAEKASESIQRTNAPARSRRSRVNQTSEDGLSPDGK